MSIMTDLKEVFKIMYMFMLFVFGFGVLFILSLFEIITGKEKDWCEYN